MHSGVVQSVEFLSKQHNQQHVNNNLICRQQYHQQFSRLIFWYVWRSRLVCPSTVYICWIITQPMIHSWRTRRRWMRLVHLMFLCLILMLSWIVPNIIKCIWSSMTLLEMGGDGIGVWTPQPRLHLSVQQKCYHKCFEFQGAVFILAWE